MPARFRRSAIALSTLALLAAVACSQAAPPPMEEPAAPANPLIGVWSVASIVPSDGSATIDPAQPGLYIFVDGYYSAVYTNTAEPRVPSATPFEATDEERVAQHTSITVNTGTYEVTGSTLTTRPIIAKSPGFVGGSATMDFAVAGDTLTLTWTGVVFADGTASPNTGSTMTLRRIQ